MTNQMMFKGKADRDEIGSFAGVTWNRQAADRDEYRRLGEGFCPAVNS